MSWVTFKARVAERLFGDVIAQREQAARQALPVSFGHDPSLFGFRRLTGSDANDQATLRDLPLVTQERMQELAYYLYLANPMAQWLINLQTAYLTGEGVTLTSPDERTATVLGAWWTDPVNNWPLKLESKVRELGLYGEQCWPAFVSEGTGRVRLGYLDPSQIEQVVLDPDNAEVAIGVVTKEQTAVGRVPSRKFRTILAVTEEELTAPARLLRESFTDGECFYYAVNKVSNGSRGWSDLLAKADWLDGYEQFMFQRLERSDLANRVVWNLELQGFTADQIKEFMRDFHLPKPGGVHAHNEKVKLNVEAPDLKAADAEVDARLFKHQCLAPMPEHWYGGGGDVNRATAGEMDEPTFKMLAMRQRCWKAILEETGRFAVRMAKAAGTLDQSAQETVSAEFPEMVTADLTKIGSVLVSIAQAVATMLLNQVITKGEARKLFSVTVQSLGVELEELDEATLAAAMAGEAFTEDAQDVLNDAVQASRQASRIGRPAKKRFRVA